ncbi:ATP-binding cassette domain-containing protein [Vannielia litorea]|uniref:ATP-binding cassette domain-containing protein n=1 Tax=Vannielia litorea TaxID=1217970 RepID=UPI001FE672C6|nr:ATP-binding cassette domain-containing protein [Vannielia litorea]
MLRVEGLNRGRMVRNVSFALRKGEILGFAGLMGAGRTEVARVIFGADPLESGTIHVHGAPRRIDSPKDRPVGGHDDDADGSDLGHHPHQPRPAAALRDCRRDPLRRLHGLDFERLHRQAQDPALHRHAGNRRWASATSSMPLRRR